MASSSRASGRSKPVRGPGSYDRQHGRWRIPSSVGVIRVTLVHRTGRREVEVRSRRPMAATRDWLIDRQNEHGYWVGELEGDTILESEYVLMMAYLGRHTDEVCVKACRYLLDQERAEGGWADLPRRPVRPRRVGQSVLRAQARRRADHRRGDWSQPRGDSRGRRCPLLQQLHPILSGAARSDRLRRHALRAARVTGHPVVAADQPERRCPRGPGRSWFRSRSSRP